MVHTTASSRLSLPRLPQESPHIRELIIGQQLVPFVSHIEGACPERPNEASHYHLRELLSLLWWNGIVLEFRVPGGSPIPVLQVLIGDSFNGKRPTYIILSVKMMAVE